MNDDKKFLTIVWIIVGNTLIACSAIAGATALFYFGHGIAGGFTLAFPFVFHFDFNKGSISTSTREV